MMQRIIRLVDHLRLFGAGLVSDPTDIVFCLALALLPAGGTVFGFSMMYWSPISPVYLSSMCCLTCDLCPACSPVMEP